MTIELAGKTYFRPEDDDPKAEHRYWLERYPHSTFVYNVINDALLEALDAIERGQTALIYNSWLRLNLAQAINLVDRLDPESDTTHEHLLRTWSDTLNRTRHS